MNIERSFIMEITSAALAEYIGGQMEIQNLTDKYIHRGRIKTIVVDGNRLIVKFAWIANGEGFPSVLNKWVKIDKLDYVTNLENYSVRNIGSSGVDVGGDDRICFSSIIFGETIVLYPPNGSKLDPEKVEGLPNASERLLAMYPDLFFDRAIANRVLVGRSWSRRIKDLSDLPPTAVLRDLLARFKHDSSAEEFLWFYIEAVTHETNVHEKVY
jgi:hypothetical protein